MNLTAAQHTAVYAHDRNLVVVAGAGSGKTRVLVERYLALLDANPDWPLNALVAITFTRKAAQEMRDRVRQSLEDRLHKAYDEADRSLWSQRLAAMDSARIDTIHGLCTTILRANAAEAGLDPGFTVMDEVEARLLLESAIERVLQQAASTDDAVLALFSAYERGQIEKVLVQLATTPVPQLPVDMMAHWRQHWHEQLSEVIRQLRQDAEFLAAAHWQPALQWPSGDRLYTEIWQPVQAHLAQLLAPETAPEDCLPLLQDMDSLIKLQVGSAAAWGGSEALAEAKDTLRYLRCYAKAAYARIGAAPGPLDEQAARLLPLWVRLVEQVQQAYHTLKISEAVLDFDDLEQRTCDLLRASEAVRLRYRSGEFRHVLVDEFQDTNARQWEIVQAVADPNQPGSLFVVGDQKQSIYAFRGADVSVFGGVRQQLMALGGASAEVNLGRSFRTHQPLVDAFNTLFAAILTRDPASPVYAHQVDLGEPMSAQRGTPPSDFPPLEVILVDTGRGNDLLDERQRDSSYGRRWEAFEIAQRLHEMVATQQPVYDRTLDAVRPVEYDDMVVLFQSTTNITLYETVFKAQGVPFVTVAGRGYYNRQEVWDLLNLLRALYNPADNLALASVLRSPVFGLSDDALLALRLVQGADAQPVLLSDALRMLADVPPDEVERVQFAADCLAVLAQQAGRVTIAELLRQALHLTGYLITLTSLPDGARRRGNVEKLLEKAESSGRLTLSAFEQYVSDLSARETREGEALLDATGAVTLMTVHNSKGLEYPVVVLADAGWTRRQSDQPALVLDADFGPACMVYDHDQAKLVAPYAYEQIRMLQAEREKAEHRRLLYVAATRAQDYLLISARVNTNTQGNLAARGWLGWLCDALELDSLPADADNMFDYGWGRLRARRVCTPPSQDSLLISAAGRTLWDQRLSATPVPAERPPLLADITVDRSGWARHLSVTQIADLGASLLPDGEFFAQRFRRQVLYDAPVRVGQVNLTPQMERLIGEIVHEVLRWWEPTLSPAELDNMLSSYAWEHGIVEPAQQRDAVVWARAMLEGFLASPAHREQLEAIAMYRELPFIYNNGVRVIHGVVDSVYQRPDGRWVIVDYKTSRLAAHPPTPDIAVQHAQRYHMQVGIYAAAILKQLDIPEDALDVYIHYIRYNLRVSVSTAQWQAALSQMEPTIGRLIGP